MAISFAHERLILSIHRYCHPVGQIVPDLKFPGGEQNPRPGGKPDIAQGRVEGGADLGARFTKAKG
jgi:hypothetical protein